MGKQDWLDEILDNLDWGYKFQMSDYASSALMEQKYEAEGLKQIARAKKAITAHLESEKLEARIGELNLIFEKLANDFEGAEFADFDGYIQNRLADLQAQKNKLENPNNG